MKITWYEKLVRNKTSERISKNGDSAVTYQITDDDEYLFRLKEKLLEEVLEVISATTHQEFLEELADVECVLATILRNITTEDYDGVFKYYDVKIEKYGDFSERRYLKYVMRDEENV